jgi:CDGSH-type Zn-finger protein
VLLCRCGKSQNQPSCDSSHARNQFTTNDRPTTCEPSDDEGVA